MFIIPIILFLIIAYFLFQYLYQKKLKNNYLKSISEYLNKNNIEHNIIKYPSIKNSFLLTINERKFYLFIDVVPANSKIQINNNSTWILKTGSSSIGEAAKKQEKLESIKPFMESILDGEKYVILLPKVDTITMYINECEIVLVNDKTNVYGAKIIKKDNFDYFIN